MNATRDRLNAAFDAVTSMRDEIIRNAERGLVETDAAALIVKGLNLALDQMQSVTLRHAQPLTLITIHVQHHPSIKQIAYCQEIQTLEIQLHDGSVRWHRGVDLDRWSLVNSDVDPVTGYYNYVFDKLDFQEQRDNALTLESMALAS